MAVARKLRREQTEAERLLWSRLRNRQLENVKFRRQQPLGPYVVDFVSLEQTLVVEVDGGQHAGGEMRRRDGERTTWLEERGYHILRFWNNEVLANLDGVLETIREALGQGTPASTA
ncbi:MAG: endonuclease domain-containing protein [Dehalococcoidia bacterium]|nr:endonuclease domain-containing protein [Dehalococcoidia bacterium]